MEKNKESFKTWNKIASLYEDKFMEFDLYNDTYDVFCEKVKQLHPRILEIGCGPGNISRYLLAHRPDFMIEGIDIAPNMIALARKNNPSATFKVMDGRQINTLKSKFDAVVCGFYLPYISEAESEKLIQDCHALLYEKGILYLSFVEGDYLESGYQTGSSGDKMYFYYHSSESLKKELTQNNFEIIYWNQKAYKKGNEQDETHTILIAEKING